MKITLKNEVTDSLIIITTPGYDPDTPVTPKFSSEEPLEITLLKSELEDSYGYYGHIFHVERTTNLDLYAALFGLKDYKIISVDKLPKPRPLPPGVCS